MDRFLSMVGALLPEYRARASRSEVEPDNLLYHADSARHSGFRAPIVPGSSVYAYASHSIVEFLGLPWLQRGFAEFRLLQPVYEGEEVRVSGVVTAVEKDGTLNIDCEAVNPQGTHCATVRVELPPRAPSGTPMRGWYTESSFIPPRSISLATLEPGEALVAVQSEFNRKTHWEYCQKGIREHHPLYDRILHPGWLLMQADRILTTNFRLPSWIHVSSAIQNHACQEEECVVETRGKVRDRYESGGDHYVVLDLGLFAGERCLQTILHTVIFRIAPRAA